MPESGAWSVAIYERLGEREREREKEREGEGETNTKREGGRGLSTAVIT